MRIAEDKSRLFRAIGKLTFVFVALAVLQARAAEGQIVHACVAKDGTTRIVDPTIVCKTNETTVNWNVVGPQGPQGPPGAAGVQGPSGPAGPSGPQGPAGAAGNTGPAGPAGPQGLAGPKGDTGTTGSVGAAGPEGSAGPQGLAGQKGDTGTTGPAGPPGPQGPAGPVSLPNGVYRDTYFNGAGYSLDGNFLIKFYTFDAGVYLFTATVTLENTQFSLYPLSASCQLKNEDNSGLVAISEATITPPVTISDPGKATLALAGFARFIAAVPSRLQLTCNANGAVVVRSVTIIGVPVAGVQLENGGVFN